MRRTHGMSTPKPKRMTSSIRIFTVPLTPRTSRTMSEALPRGGMKSISATVPLLGLEARFEDERVAAIAARRRVYLGPGAISQRPFLCVAEERGKAGIGIESRPAQPVDRAVAADQRCGLAIADQRIVLDPLRQCVASLENDSETCVQLPPVNERSRVAAFKAVTSIGRRSCRAPPAGAGASSDARRSCRECWAGPSRRADPPAKPPKAATACATERRDRIENVAVDAVMSQDVVERPARATAPRRSRRDRAERAFHLEIAERAPARKGRQIMRVNVTSAFGR